MSKEETRLSLRCNIYPFGEIGSYKYVVVCTSYRGKWVLSRHKKRATWETQGGHIETGESPLDAARRELFEESGVEDADIYPVCDYLGYDKEGSSYGTVFLAVAHTLGALPKSEMKEIGIFDTLPAALTYPQVSPVFYKEAKRVLSGLTNNY